jgi:uncharacterized protein YndB with AHSA1/START domain
MTNNPNPPPVTITQQPSDNTQLVIVGLYADFSPGTLFECWTRPDALTQWWPQTATFEPKLNGAYNFAWPDQKQTLHGTITAYDPPNKLAFTWAWAGMEKDPVTTVTLTFEQYLVKPGLHGAKLTLIQGPYTNSPADQKMRTEQHLAGWLHFLPLIENVGLD